MNNEWFKARYYKHLDVPVGRKFANRVHDPDFVESHSWLPLIHYVKRVKRYKSKQGKTIFKDRDIMYASHRDACILSKYAYDLTEMLDHFYEEKDLSDCVIAYRKLSKSNYDFAADAYRFSLDKSPCIVLCFDITGFFDNLDHRILKYRLRNILNVQNLSEDWYKVFRQVTRYRYIELRELASHPTFSPRLNSKERRPIATIEEIKAEKILIQPNRDCWGIPQGTPISSALSNLYMIEVDKIMAAACRTCGALYQRYSDDILVICKTEDEKSLAEILKACIIDHKLEIKDEKTERAEFDPINLGIYQYLGFNISYEGAVIRPSSLGKQWRKAKRKIEKIKNVGQEAVEKGRSHKIYTRKLRKGLGPVGVRNFSLYARRSAKAFRSKRIIRQILKFERMADKAIRDIHKK